MRGNGDIQDAIVGRGAYQLKYKLSQFQVHWRVYRLIYRGRNHSP